MAIVATRQQSKRAAPIHSCQNVFLSTRYYYFDLQTELTRQTKKQVLPCGQFIGPFPVLLLV